MSQSPVDLASLFGAALSTVRNNQQQLNQLDTANGAHGDHMVENMRIVTEALQAKQSQSPSEALQYASQMLQVQGQGTSAQQYAQGLSGAADKFQGQSQMNPSDIMHLVSSIMGSVQPEAGPQPGAPANAMEHMMGLASQQQQGSQRGMLGAALPAGMAFLQAKASGADNVTAAHRAVMSALTAGTVNPLQVGNAHSASAGLVAQSLLQALAGGM
jgi:3-hydroxy-3-methylglutaryl CoA synthase